MVGKSSSTISLWSREAAILSGSTRHAVEPAAERANSAALKPVVLSQHLIAAVHSIDHVALKSKVIQQVVDQRLPGRQADSHRDAGTDEQDGAAPLDRSGQDLMRRSLLECESGRLLVHLP